MKKIVGLIGLLIMLTGCAETMALLGPASTSAGSGNVLRSSVSSVASYTIKKQTGLSPIEHVSSFVEKNNPQQKREKCVSFLEASNTEICSAVRKRIAEVKEKIQVNSQIKRLD
tara:strand:+ start:1147 stop:1488 length:342 start_codon:yes stop_codon:yes gene_type:complete